MGITATGNPPPLDAPPPIDPANNDAPPPEDPPNDGPPPVDIPADHPSVEGAQNLTDPGPLPPAEDPAPPPPAPEPDPPVAVDPPPEPDPPAEPDTPPPPVDEAPAPPPEVAPDAAPPEAPPAGDAPIDAALVGNVQRDPGSSAGQRAVDVAMDFVKRGVMYQPGGKGPNGVDCSGLVSYALDQAGMQDGYKTSYGLAASGSPISRDQLQPGDVIIYGRDNGHVAIYAGDGQIIQASQSGHPVTLGPISSGGTPSGFRRIGGDRQPSTISV